MRWIALAAALALPAAAVELKPETVAAFERYIRQTEQRLDSNKDALWSGQSSARAQRVKQGEVVVEPFHAKALTSVPSGLIHDWVGAIFLPGVTLERTIALVGDYDHHKQYYRPEVADSRILEHDGNHYRIFLRLIKKQVITVVLDTEHDVRYEIG